MLILYKLPVWFCKILIKIYSLENACSLQKHGSQHHFNSTKWYMKTLLYTTQVLPFCKENLKGDEWAISIQLKTSSLEFQEGVFLGEGVTWYLACKKKHSAGNNRLGYRGFSKPSIGTQTSGRNGAIVLPQTQGRLSTTQATTCHGGHADSDRVNVVAL